MDFGQAFLRWRAIYQEGWGQAWWLASEIDQRYGDALGLTLYPITHEGLGFYGIKIINNNAAGVVPGQCQGDSSTGALACAGDKGDLLFKIQNIGLAHGAGPIQSCFVKHNTVVQ